MKLKCYGTGAAEAIPALFCSCLICEVARAKGGREVRSRHGSTVDSDIQFDLSPDFFYHIQTLGLDPRRIRHLIVTHAHSDHFSRTELSNRRPPYSLTEEGMLSLIGSRETLDRILPEIEGGLEAGRMEARTAIPFVQMRLDEETTLVPLPANHAPEIGGALLYVLRRGEKSLLYAHDTGPLLNEVVEWLAGQQIDAITLDCTGAYRGAGEHHMEFAGCERTFHILRENGGLKPEARLIINHFSHGGGATYEQTKEEAEKRGWIASYDGIEIQW